MSAASSEKKGAKRKTAPKKSVMGRLFSGQVLSLDFFARNWLPVMVLVLLALVNIAGKYLCQTRMEQIRRLEHELEVVKAESVRVRSVYMGRTCESSMKELVDSMHLGLSVADCPPFKVEK